MANFTHKFLMGLRPGAVRYEERDAGCPGLLCRVNTDGARVFEVVVSEGRARRRVRLGQFPDVSLATARRLAAEAKAAPALHTSGRTVAVLWQVYKAERAPVLRAWRDIEGAWKWAEPKISHLRLEDISMRHGADLIEYVSRKSSPHRARHVIKCLAPMFKFAAGRGMIPGNPWAGLLLPPAAPTRERVLSRDEWAALWAWGLAAPYPWGPLVRVLMLSGQRLGEVAGMRWAEIDGDVWTVPSVRHKGKRGHEVPLSVALAGILAGLPRHDEHVFSTRAGKAIAPGSKLLALILRETATGGWRFHDIRRTAATRMSEAGVPRFTVARVLGHADGGVSAVYDRYGYRAEKRDALDRLALTVAPPAPPLAPGNVVAFPRSRNG